MADANGSRQWLSLCASVITVISVIAGDTRDGVRSSRLTFLDPGCGSK